MINRGYFGVYFYGFPPISRGYFGVHFYDFSPTNPLHSLDLALSSYLWVYNLRVLMTENLTFVILSCVLHLDSFYIFFGVSFCGFTPISPWH